MPKSLRRQKILFEREMQRLVLEEFYVRTKEGYSLKEPFLKNLDEFALNYSKISMKEFQKDFPDRKFK